MAYYEKNLSILAFFNFVVGVARILTLITGGSEMTAGEIVLAMFRVAALFVMYVLLFLAAKKKLAKPNAACLKSLLVWWPTF